MTTLQLRSLPLSARVGLTGLIAVFFIGLATSVAHMVFHHQNRDEEPGLSMMDLTGAYHGVNVPSPLRMALGRGHPEGLPVPTREALRNWLELDPDSLSRQYDNLDLGDLAPSELIAANCLDCHGKGSAAAKGAGLALDTWDATKRVAFSKQIDPPPLAILVMSTHAHALTLAAIAALLALMLAFTRWSRRYVGLLVLCMGVGLFVDIGGWWAARQSALFVWAIVIGGAMFNIATALSLVALLAELWLPARRTS